MLYQIVYYSRDTLTFQWESRFQHQYGCLRDEVLKTYDESLNCGILAHGAARMYCDGCNTHSLSRSPASVAEYVAPVAQREQ